MSNVSRAQRIQAAIELIKKEPWLGRRQINQQLKEQFNIGLQSAYVDQLKKENISTRKEFVELSIKEKAPKSFGKSRQQRYRKFINAGFRKTEANTLSKIRSNTPYLNDIIKSRKQILNKARRFRISKKEWTNWLELSYKKRLNPEKESAVLKSIKTKGILASQRMSIFALLRYFEASSKDKYPDWQTPAKKQIQKRIDFIPHKVVKQMKHQEDKYPRGAHYK